MDWEIVTIIKAFAWPLTIVFMAWFLRKEIRTLLGRLESATLPGGTKLTLSKFGQPSVDKSIPKITHKRTSSKKNTGKWGKCGNVFWFGHDLMWTMDVLLRDAPRSTIVHGLKQSLHHLKQLGLSKTIQGEILQRLYADAEHSLEGDWTASKRDKVASDLRRVLDELGAVAESRQPDYSASE